MLLLLIGILLWALVHFIPVFASEFRGKITQKIGLGPYKGLVALSLIGAIALMVIGWQAYPEIYYYPQAEGMREVTFVLVFAGIVLFIASGVKTNIKRCLRHPQLTGVMTWAFAHLLSNGEARAVLLFSGFFIWALLMIIGINKRDGAWGKPQAVSVILDLKVLVAAVAFYALLTYLHQYFTGIALV